MNDDDGEWTVVRSKRKPKTPAPAERQSEQLLNSKQRQRLRKKRLAKEKKAAAAAAKQDSEEEEDDDESEEEVAPEATTVDTPSFETRAKKPAKETKPPKIQSEQSKAGKKGAGTKAAAEPADNSGKAISQAKGQQDEPLTAAKETADQPEYPRLAFLKEQVQWLAGLPLQLLRRPQSAPAAKPAPATPPAVTPPPKPQPTPAASKPKATPAASKAANQKQNVAPSSADAKAKPANQPKGATAKPPTEPAGSAAAPSAKAPPPAPEPAASDSNLPQAPAPARAPKPEPAPPAPPPKPKGPSAEACGGPLWHKGQFKLHEVLAGDKCHHSLVSSLDIAGTTVVSSGWDNKLRVWSLTEDGLQPVRPLQGHADHVTGLSINSDATKVLSASRDCTLRIWDIQSGGGGVQRQKIYTYDPLACMAADWESSTAITGTRSGTVSVWSVATSKKQATLRGHEDEVCCVSRVAGAGPVVASGSSDTTVRLWDPRAKQAEVGCLEGCRRRVYSIAALEHSLWAGDFSGAVKVFDLRGLSSAPPSVGERPAALLANAALGGGVDAAPIAAVRVSRDGRRIMSSSALYYDDDDDEVQGCVQVRACSTNGEEPCAAEYMYSLPTSGGQVSCLADDGDVIAAGHVGGSLSIWQVCEKSKNSDTAVWDMVDGEREGCEDAEEEDSDDE